MQSIDTDAGVHGSTSQPPAREAVNPSLSFAATIVHHAVRQAMPAQTVPCLLGQEGSDKTTFPRASNRLNDKVSGCRRNGDVLVGRRNIVANRDLLEFRRTIGTV